MAVITNPGEHLFKHKASKIKYSTTSSGLRSNDVQGAVDEVSRPIRKFGIKSVGLGASSQAIVFADDEESDYPASFPSGHTVCVVAVPSWDTTIRVSVSPDEDGVTFAFGTAAPGGYNGIVYWQAMGR